MATKLDIFNLALNMLGAKTLTTVDDNVKEAITLKAIYNFVVAEVISDFPYRFNTWIARIFSEKAKAVTSITHVTTTATVTLSNHGYTSGNIVEIVGSNQNEYNGKFKITMLTSNTFSYTMNEDPGSNASGNITARLSHLQFDYAYKTPTDMLEAIRLHNAVVDDTFLIKGSYLYTNEPDEIILKYAKNSYQESEFTSSFYWLLASRLAAESAIAITGDRQFATALMNRYLAQKEEARFQDIKEEFEEKTINQTYMKKDYNWLNGEIEDVSN